MLNLPLAHGRMRRRELLLAACGIGVSSCRKKKRLTSQPPATPAPVAETGLASWYGHPYHGRAAANGEIYDMEKMTAAHRTLAFGTWVRVTNLTNGKTVEVRITDRGPFIAGRIIDLSHAAARTIDLIGPGVAQVRLDVIAPPAISPSATATASLFAVQVGEFPDRERAERLRLTLSERHGTARIVFRDGKPALWRVLVGSEPNPGDAALLAQKLQDELGTGLVVRLDN